MADLLVFASPAADGVRYNLPALAGAARHIGPGQTATERIRSGVDVTIIDGPAPVVASPAAVAGWCDGIQNSTIVAYNDGQPVHAAYLAAGASDGRRPASLTGLCEQVALYAAEGDPAAAALSEETGIPVTDLPNTDRTRLSALAATHIGNDRAKLERQLVERLNAAVPGQCWAVDGSLAHMPDGANLIGIVKTHASRYLHDEAELYSLAAGWRSSVFTFTHRRREDDDEGVTVWSAYVRVRHIPDSAWDAGLLRVETTRRDNVDAAAALLCAHTQGAAAAATDARWDRHLDPIAWCEKLLRDRRPIMFAHIG